MLAVLVPDAIHFFSTCGQSSLCVFKAAGLSNSLSYLLLSHVTRVSSMSSSYVVSCNQRAKLFLPFEEFWRTNAWFNIEVGAASISIFPCSQECGTCTRCVILAMRIVTFLVENLHKNPFIVS